MPHPTALIAEDEPLLAESLKAELARIWPELRVVAEAGDGLSAVRLALAQRPTVCFLDIRMPGQSGLEAAQALAEDWPGPQRGPAGEAVADSPFPLLVFVTAYDQYALQAFDAQAVDYLVKPVDGARLSACVQRLRARLDERRATTTLPGDPNAALEQALAQLRALLGQAAATPAAGGGPPGAPGTAGGHGAPGAPGTPGTPGTPAAAPRLTVIQAQVGATVHMVPIEQVLYFEAADKYVRVVTAEREHLIRLSLRELMPQLDDQVFWQVHRSLLVRASAVTTAQRDESGKVFLSLRGRPERLTASRLYAHLFKGM